VPDEPTSSIDRRYYAPASVDSLDVSRLSVDTDVEVSLPIPVSTSVEFADVCPGAILDTDPTGQGVGVWVLVDSGIDEDGDKYCAYAYASGIA
jgi:hypothetical protein